MPHGKNGDPVAAFQFCLFPTGYFPIALPIFFTASPTLRFDFPNPS
jgi:hypothetical protein